jgi:hypothetical protein
MPASLEHSHFFPQIKMVGNVSLRNPFWLPVDLARGHPGADFRAVVSKCGNCYLKPQEERVSAKPKMPVKGPGY